MRGLAECGARLRPLIDCLGRFQAELDHELDGLESAGLDADARRRIRAARELAIWGSGVGGDLLGEVLRMQAGWCPIDLVERVERLARDWARTRRHRIDVRHRGGQVTCWGNPVVVQDGLARLAERVVDRVSTSSAVVSVDVRAAHRSLRLCMTAAGPCAIDGVDSGDLRSVVDHLGWRLIVDRVGPSGSRVEVEAPA